MRFEGRDAAGVARSWYVRLWNYATGTPEDAAIALDFASLDGGFLLPGEADPVWAGDVDRVFVSLVPPGYATAGGVLPASVEAWVELTDDAITEADLIAGRWDGAACTVLALDWSDPAAPPLVLATGELGDVSVKDGAFTVELRGATALLERPVVEQTSPDCRAALGDGRCRVDLAPRTRFARVVSADGGTVTLDAGEPVSGAYGFGRLRWFDGGNAGLASAIAASSGATVTLRDPPFAMPLPGALVELVEGCDRTFATCRARFANAANFRGEPHLPGNDLLGRYGTD